MAGFEDLQYILENQRELANEQRQVEADAFDVMKTRPTYFGLKLLFGINHHAPESEPPSPETEEPQAADQQEARVLVH